MAINLMDAWAPALEKKMTTGSLVFGKALGKYSWTGVKTVKSITPVTQTPNDYDIGDDDGVASRFGALTEVEDSKHEYTLQYSKSNNMSIDKENNTSQKMQKAAGVIIKAQIEEQYFPMMDKEALSVYATTEGVGDGVDSSLTSSNVAAAFTAARKSFVNSKTMGTPKQMVAWVGASTYEKLLNSDEFLNLEKVGTKALVDGAIGKIAGFSVIEVPDEYIPENTNFVCANRRVLLNPLKIKTTRILTEHPDFDGAALQFHWQFGAFVEEANLKGVYVSRTQSLSV